MPDRSLYRADPIAESLLSAGRTLDMIRKSIVDIAHCVALSKSHVNESIDALATADRRVRLQFRESPGAPPDVSVGRACLAVDAVGDPRPGSTRVADGGGTEG